MSVDTFQLEEDLAARSFDRRLVAWLLGYARPQWRALGGCVMLLLALTALQLSQPYITKVAIDRVMRPAAGSGAAALSDQVRQLAALALLYLGIVIASVSVEYWQSRWLRVTGQRIIAEVRHHVFAHLQGLSLRYFDTRPAGRIVTRVTNDVEALNEMYTSVLVNLFADVFFIVGAMILLLRLDWRLALVSFAVLPLIMLTALVFRRFSRVAYRDMRVKLARINAMLAESFAGMRIIQLFGREAKSAEEFGAVNSDFYEATRRLIRIFATFGPTLDMLTTMALAAVVWYGGVRVIGGAITIGTLYAFTAYTRRLYAPVSALAEKYNIFQAALASAERITELLGTEPTVQDPAAPIALPTLTAVALERGTPGGLAAATARGDGGELVARPLPPVPAVEFEGAWFSYNDSDWVLADVSFRVAAGETVAFVGHTGAGKSTIMNLLPRFYDVQRGAVRVHGIDVRELAQRDLRRRVGIVMQDVFLFAGDVAGNISLADPSIARAEVIRSAEIVGADRFISRLPGGYDEPVVERGLSLSTGQRQLISFARALATDPEILILDEATASVDTETEEALQNAMRAAARGRTMLIVAHRLATIRDADRIYVMHRGRIVEEGCHDELLTLDGLYRRLWELQFASGEPI